MIQKKSCPNCWGYQEYDAKVKEVKVETEHKTVYNGRNRNH